MTIQTLVETSDPVDMALWAVVDDCRGCLDVGKLALYSVRHMWDNSSFF